jgi:uncharacterized membrane protein YphA (DoxX/SURF4 family)
MDAPRWVAATLTWPPLVLLARIALTSAFWIGGLQKLSDFRGAVSEQAHFGLQPAWLWAVAAIIVELGGSALVICGRWVWLGAGGLGVLTAVAMGVANDFWRLHGHEQFIEFNSFFEHFGLIAGFVILSIVALHSRASRSLPDNRRPPRFP